MDTSNDMKQSVELYISCRNLKDLDFFGKSDPIVKVFIQVNGNWNFIAETERIKDNLNPDFRTTVKLDYVFETKQPLRFEVFDVDEHSSDDLIGSIETTLGEIMGSRKQTFTADLQGKSKKSTGKLIVRGDTVGNSKNEIVWQWSGVKLMNTDGIFGKSDPFLRFFKYKSGDWFQVYQTEFIKNNLNPVWKTCWMDEDKLCGGDYTQPIKIECWDDQTDGNHRYIGVCEVTLERLQKGEDTFELSNPKKNKSTGILKLLNFSIGPKVTFLDYLRGGEQLSSIIAIDFTASNGSPSSSSSLHARLSGGKPNEYQQAISSVCQIILNYDYDKKIPVYGFGATLNFPNLRSSTSDCFPCSGNVKDPEVLGLEGVMDVYRHALDHVDLSGPTNFAPVIKETLKACKKNQQSGFDIYTILLILTDGAICDFDKTLKKLVKAAHLPISLIIVGVGGADFSSMEALDGDKGFPQGKAPARDVVQFVPFRSFNNDMEQLAKSVLAEVPKQLVEYKNLVGKRPKPPLY